MTTQTPVRPLGVRPEVPLTEEQVRALCVLEEYDLTPVRNRLLNNGVMPQSWVDDALFEFRRFLGLQVLAPGPRTMFSHQVDLVWHTCLLFTRLYADYCQAAFGYFFHHEPATHAQIGRQEQFQDFVQLYKRAYGAPNRLWYMQRQGE
jgi:hypothetical protein